MGQTLSQKPCGVLKFFPLNRCRNWGSGKQTHLLSITELESLYFWLQNLLSYLSWPTRGKMGMGADMEGSHPQCSSFSRREITPCLPRVLCPGGWEAHTKMEVETWEGGTGYKEHHGDDSGHSFFLTSLGRRSLRSGTEALFPRSPECRTRPDTLRGQQGSAQCIRAPHTWLTWEQAHPCPSGTAHGGRFLLERGRIG